MKRLEFLGLLAGLPLALAGMSKPNGDEVPEGVSRSIAVYASDGTAYRIKRSSFERDRRGAHFGLKDGLVSSRQDFNYSEPEESVRRIVAEEKKK